MTESALNLGVNELICVGFLARATRVATWRESRTRPGKFDRVGEIGREALPESARMTNRVVRSARRVHFAPAETFTGRHRTADGG
jgi:hypothetical protein